MTIRTNGGTIEATGSGDRLTADVDTADGWSETIERIDDARLVVVFAKGSRQRVEVDVALTSGGIVSSTRSSSSS